MPGRDNRFQPFMDHHNDGHPFFRVVMLVLFLLLLVAALLFLWQLITARRGGAPQLAVAGGAAPDLLQIVRTRYARGEIGREEFLAMSADFGAPVESPPPAAADDSIADTKS